MPPKTSLSSKFSSTNAAFKTFNFFMHSFQMFLRLDFLANVIA